MTPGLIIALICIALFIGYLIGRNQDKSIPSSSSSSIKPTDPKDRLSPSDIMTIQNLLREKKKIEAIKIYREVMGSSLKDAKEAIEDIDKNL